MAATSESSGDIFSNSRKISEQTPMKKLFLTLGLIAGFVFSAAGAQAFNPQPDPPGVHGGDE
jgi:hypothetical protein